MGRVNCVGQRTDARRLASIRIVVLLRGLLVGAAVAACARPHVENFAPKVPPDTSAYPPVLDGTLSGNGDLEEDQAPKQPHARLPTVLGRWFVSKKQFEKRTGLSFGGSYGVLWQNYSESLLDEPSAVGHKVTLNIDYALLHRDAPNALSLDLVLEGRRPLGTELPPLRGGIAAGSIVPTAATWGEFDFGVTQFYLRQNLGDGRFQYAIGKIFAPNFVNPYPFFDDNRQFFNQTFSTSPTIASPLRGFGLVGAWFPVAHHGYYVQSGMYTANSDDTGLTIDDFFTTGEHFYHLDLGWSALAHKGVPIQARGPMDEVNFHVVGWYKNEQELVPEANGIAFNASPKVGENALVFLRGGWSRGWITDANISAGFGWRPAHFTSDLLGMGAGWVRPSDRILRQQYTGEVFYRYTLTQNLALTPDLQFVQHPAINPAEDALLVLGFRGRVTF